MKAKILVLSVIVCLSFSHLVKAQTITLLSGRTGSPLEMATLISMDLQVFATTNAKGQADLTPFKGAKDIEIRSIGYMTAVVSYEELQLMHFVFRLTPTAIDLDKLVISATRSNQTADNVPSKIISITPKDIALQNPQTAADLLASSGAVFVQKSQQGGGSPMIRGFATNRLLYTVDGVRMNTAIFRGGNIQNVINIDPFAVENAEVLFGPGSVIYGSDAIGGVMSFQTLTPQLSLNDTVLLKGKAVTRYSSANNERTAHFDVSVGWKKWAFVSSVSHWDFDDLRQGSNGPEDYIKDYYVTRQNNTDVVVRQDDALLQKPSAYSQTNLMQKLRFKPDQHWDFQYGFHFSETSPYGRYDRHNRTENNNPRYGEWDYGPQSWMMNNLNIFHTKATKLYSSLTLRLAQQSFGESRISRDFNDSIREVRTEAVEAYSLNLDLKKNIGKKNSLFYGVEYVMNDVTSTAENENIISGMLVDAADRYPQATWMSMAAYMNNELRICSTLTLQAGMRYNHFLLDADFSDNITFYPLPFTTANINKGALTGSFGAVYHPTKSFVVKASVGTAFRSPNVDDMGKIFDSEPASVVVPNADLEAEYAYNLDLGVAKVFGDWLKLDVTGYYTLLNNALVRRDFSLNGQDSIIYDGTMSKVQAIQNAAVARVYGVQASMDITLPQGFSIFAMLNFQEGEEELDDGSISASRHAAPLYGLARLRYQVQRLQLECYALYQGERSHDELAVSEQSKDEIYALDANGETYAPAWYTLNVKAMYVLNNSLSFSAGVENITDQRYRPYSSGLSGAGRNLFLSVQCRF